MIGAEALVPGFVFGLANAAHCAGMCGVFAFQAAGATRRPGRTALYLSGKTCTYVFVGALAGWLGGQALGVAAGAQIVLGYLVGVVLLLAGLRWIVPPRAGSGLGAAWSRMLAPLLRGAHDAHRVGGPFALGAVTGLLPCGVVYIAALQAGALGSPLESAASMAAFGLGTVPVLTVIALLGRGAVSRLGPARLRVAGGLLVAGTGLFTLVRTTLHLLAHTAAAAGGPPCCH